MLRKAGCAQSVISSNPDEISKATKLILPGVGAFDMGMENLHKSGLVELLNRRVLEEKIPILGICLGAQLLTKSSEEGTMPGLGWVDATTLRFQVDDENKNLKIPNMGWCDVSMQKESRFILDLPADSRFYFVHSYHIVCRDKADVLLTAKHGITFTAAIEKENIIGAQFHPEKSHKFGLTLFKNFISNY